MDSDWNRAYEVALAAAKEGAIYLKKYLGKLSSIRCKTSNTDLVTEADEASEVAIKEIIGRAFPNDGVLAEESGGPEILTQDRLWVIDPLDGTTNYTHQYPFFAISIALLCKGEPVVGIIYNPFFNELFTAVKGKGSFLNQEPIKVSCAETIESSLLATGFSYDRNSNPDNNYAQFCLLTSLCQGVRRCGSASIDLAYVAAGRLDGYWERGLQPWDVAAGTLIVNEAGGEVTGYENNQINLFNGRIVASNRIIHKELCDTITKLSK